MFSINFRGVRICQQLILVGCVGLLFGGGVFGQGLRISDADVSLAVPVVWEDGRKQASTSSEGNPGRVLKTRPLIKLTSYKRTPDQILLEEAVYRESARYNIDPDLVFALVWQESGGRLGAVSPKNARGPMQLMPATAARFGVRNPHDAKEAVRGGVAYLVWLLDRFNGNVSLALAAYNSGEASVEAYLEGKTIVLRDGKVINRRGVQTANGIPPYDETVNYVRRIAERYRVLRAARTNNSAK
jgi:soluble lytic murein transglycosylase-like protein